MAKTPWPALHIIESTKSANTPVSTKSANTEAYSASGIIWCDHSLLSGLKAQTSLKPTTAETTVAFYWRGQDPICSSLEK